MKIEVLTIFPEIFDGFLKGSLIGKALERGLVTIKLTDIREFADPPHFRVDDSPYGGGAGMLMKPEPLARAIEAAKARMPQAKVVLLAPSGEVFSQKLAFKFKALPELILLCGRYEGIDERVIELFVDQEISIGDFVLMGGEVAAMAVMESCIRLLDDVLGNRESLTQESFGTSGEQPLLEAPQYTRPPEFMGKHVPEALLSGNHKLIAEWRQAQSLQRTRARRPDLIKRNS
ncbi:MAG: tRNA (guanosine(37)-N1)-methyltransferase TrmD [Oligoflexia bacterium]|nr:tRNA (guanosine(37)-N1)-methyltransferase TrmD [Oligoflexia bacterium]